MKMCATHRILSLSKHIYNCNKKYDLNDYKFLICTCNCKFPNYLFLNTEYQIISVIQLSKVSFSHSFYYKSEMCKTLYSIKSINDQTRSIYKYKNYIVLLNHL